ncbi:class I adenylate-forming enzyme family protein [Pseudomonas japonica]|uniref:Acyl-CoA synthetase (AMP-forming)/AMP-acid ligase II n=1 Tax=Pseudomonas japonica TaxID=256466 RepID=A0A239E3P7_9PSED|nr:class I adenylate-forming enzyme family protein [Pseudomonas japonica]SNS39365.1 Acyl-CoA synthetase (AMP-forming)/AMP-acid ligase II [Pseudomonas japonica]
MIDSSPSLVAAINHWAATCPDEPACIEGSTELSWADFSKYVQAAIERLPADAGSTVGLVAGNNAEHMVFACAVIATGRAFQTFPVDVADDVLAVLLRNSGVAQLFTDDENKARCLALVEPDIDVMAIQRNQLPGLGDGVPCLLRDNSPQGNDDLSIVFSSGTTGQPKGIVHSAAARRVVAEAVAGLGLTRGAVNLVCLPMHNNLSMVTWLSALWNGACNVVLTRFDPVELGQAALRRRATHLVMSPLHYRELLSAPVDRQTQFASLHLHICSSSRLHAWEKRQVVEGLPGRFAEIYGVTEGGVGTLLDCSAEPRKLHTVGKPLPGYDMRIIDEQGQEVAHGVVGRIVGRSHFMMTRYASHGSMEVWTAPGMAEDLPPFIVPGDLGYLDAEGYLVVCDRAIDAAMWQGNPVFPSDIEAFIAAEYQARDVAAKVYRDSAGDLESVAIYLVPTATVSSSPETVMAKVDARFNLDGRLRLHFVEALPRNAMGKILRHRLAEPA